MKNTHDPNEPRQSKRSAGRSSAGGRRRTISSGASASQGSSPLDSARTNIAVPGHAGVHDRAGRVDNGRKVSSGDNHNSNHSGNHADAEQSTQDGFASAQPPISGRPIVAELGRGLIAGLLGWFLPSFFLSLLCGICTLLFSVESTTSLTGAIMPLATASVLLSQGVGVRYEFLDITLIPLLGTILFVAVGSAVTAKWLRRHALISYVSFALVWIGLDCLVFAKSALTPADSLPVAAGKFALMVLVCFAVAQGNAPIRAGLRKIRTHISQPLARTLDSSLRMARAFLILMAIIAFITVAMWVFLGFDAMRTVASFLAMGNVTFWSTCIITLLWLPNLCMWALSWIVGPGFSIGQIATFTLWNGQASNLPAVPVFGIFPTAVADARLRVALEATPAVGAFVIGCFFLWSSKRLDILHRRMSSKPALSSPRSIVDYLLALVCMCLSSIWIVVACLVAFILSSGGMGSGRLGHLGISDVWASTQAISKPAAMGFFASVLLLFLVSCIESLIRFMRSRHHMTAAPHAPRDLSSTAPQQKRSADSATSVDSAINEAVRLASESTDGMSSSAPDSDTGRGTGRDASASYSTTSSRSASQMSQSSSPWHADAPHEPTSIREALDSRYFPSESSLPAVPAADDASDGESPKPTK